MFIKPASGIKIFCPTTRTVLGESGQEKNDDLTYWTRAAMAGDVTISEAAPVVVKAEELKK